MSNCSTQPHPWPIREDYFLHFFVIYAAIVIFDIVHFSKSGRKWIFLKIKMAPVIYYRIIELLFIIKDISKC